MGFGRNGKQASTQSREVMSETQQDARTSGARAPRESTMDFRGDNMYLLLAGW